MSIETAKGLRGGLTVSAKYGPCYTRGPDGDVGIPWQEYWPESEFTADAVCTCGHAADDHARICGRERCDCDGFQVGPVHRKTKAAFRLEVQG